jgi:hypothetical protein
LERLYGTFKRSWEDMEVPVLTDEKVLLDEIEALENAINNPSYRTDYLCDFWSNADLLLRALKMTLKGVNTDGQGKDYPKAS